MARYPRLRGNFGYGVLDGLRLAEHAERRLVMELHARAQEHPRLAKAMSATVGLLGVIWYARRFHPARMVSAYPLRSQWFGRDKSSDLEILFGEFTSAFMTEQDPTRRGLIIFKLNDLSRKIHSGSVLRLKPDVLRAWLSNGEDVPYVQEMFDAGVSDVVNVGVKNVWAQKSQSMFSPKGPTFFPRTRDVPEHMQTTSIEELMPRVARHLFRFSRNKKNGRNSFVHAFQLFSNYFVAPAHFFTDTYTAGSLEADFSIDEFIEFQYEAGVQGGIHHQGSFRAERGVTVVKVPHKDLVIVHLLPVTPVGDDMMKWLCPTTALRVAMYTKEAGTVVTDPITGDYKILTGLQAFSFNLREGKGYWRIANADLGSEEGWCGIPYIVRYGSGVWIAAFHIGKDADPASSSYGEELTGQELMEAVSSFPAVLQTAPSGGFDPSQGSTIQSVVQEGGVLWKYSPLHAAPNLNAIILGEMEGHGRGGNRTKVAATMFAQDFEGIVAPILLDDRYEVPKFDHVLVDGVYYEPMANAAKDLQHDAAVSMVRILEAASDYLDGAQHLPNTRGWKKLTIVEALQGIEESVINGFDKTTSVGFPYFRRKGDFCKFENGAWNLGPEMAGMVQAIQECWDRGKIFHPIVTWSKKDEAVRASKNAIRKIRIFNNLPFAYNLMLKRLVAPIHSFMQTSPEFFEIAVGLNMVSDDCGRMVNRLMFGATGAKVRAGRAGNLIDGDMEKFDKRQLTVFLYGVAAVYCRLAEILHYPERDIRELKLAFLGLIHHVALVGSSVMFLNFSNISGSLVTLMLNCIVQCLMFRMIFYELRPAGCEAYFRDAVALVTLGDDSLQSVRNGFSWYNFMSIRGLMPRLNHVFKPGDKNDGDYLYKTLGQVSFLKRRFLWNASVQAWFAKIEEASLCRQMTIMKTTTAMSKEEHHAAILTNILREYFLYGQQTYEERLKLVRLVAAKHGLLEVPTLEMPVWSDMLRKYRSKAFTTW